MSDRPRMHRPDPERTQPIRNWGTLFGPPPGAPPHPPSVPFAGPFGPPFTPPFAPPGGAPASGPGAAVAQGVHAGYRVIEEYLRQGQNAARMMYGPWVGAGPGAPWSAPPAWSGGAMPSLGPWADLLQSMLGAFPLFWPPPPGEVHGAAGPFTAGQAPRGPVPIVTPPPAHHAAHTESVSHAPRAPHAAHAPPAARVPVRAAVVVEAASDQRAEVTVELLGARADGDYVVHALRLPDGDGYRITGATAEGLADDDLVRVTVRVPADAPPGAYSGLIIDRASGLPRGSVTARVLARP